MEKIRTVSAKEFTRIWMEVHQARGELADVAARVGRSKKVISVRASILRRKGVKLPSFRIGDHGSTDVDSLNAIIEGFGRGDE